MSSKKLIFLIATMLGCGMYSPFSIAKKNIADTVITIHPHIIKNEQYLLKVYQPGENLFGIYTKGIRQDAYFYRINSQNETKDTVLTEVIIDDPLDEPRIYKKNIPREEEKRFERFMSEFSK